jgi:hypothetical protein
MGRSRRRWWSFYPTRIRYTSMSLPYHIGNGWFGRAAAGHQLRP